MTAVCALLERCAAKEKEEAAWAEWWTIVARAASYPIRHLLRRHGLDPDLAADVLQELYEHLEADSCARLHAFQGTTEAELRAYLHEVAHRLATKRLGQWRRDRKHEADAVRGAGPPARDGPTEQQVESARREVQSGMSRSDR